jgi:hypothetical protein
VIAAVLTSGCAVSAGPITRVAADGSAVLGPADLLTVLDALADAAAFREARGRACCLDCVGHPAPLCGSHADDLDQAAAYRAAAARLGDYR